MRIQWLWQTGELDYPRLEPAWGRASGVQMHAFFDDVAAALVEASLHVCRSGAMTLAEITALGKPAILVPFPGAEDDHQTANAREHVDAGAAIQLPDAELSGERLSREIGALLADPERLGRMGAASTRLARPRATLDLVAAIDRQARKHR